MGYAGYSPTAFPPARPTDVETAVGAIKNLDTLEVLQKLVYNAAVAPKDDKFRRLRLSNEKINTVIVQVPGAIEALQSLGWVQDEEALEFMMIPAGKYMNMPGVRIVETAIAKLKKEVEQAGKDRIRNMSRSSSAASIAAEAAATAQKAAEAAAAAAVKAA